jgi:hypothetical protein
MNKRFLYLDNGVLTDYTSALGNYKTGSMPMPFVANRDYLFIGSRLPFNHFYVKLANSNAHISSIAVEYWSDNGWNAVVNTLDETEAFANSGFVTFTPDKDKVWKLEEKSNVIPQLSSTMIYDNYWLRITFVPDLHVNTTVDWIGNIFSDDNDLAAEFPDLVRSNVLSAFQTGKTNWQEQAVKAAEIIEHDLANRGILDGSESILDREWYKNASVQKTAEIIFSAFGDDYIDQRARAREEYGLRLVKRLARVDKNLNAIEDPYERKVVTGFLSR